MPDFRSDLGPGFAQVVTFGNTVTSGSANTKGSWTEIVASTAFAADELLLTLGQSNAICSGLVDIAIGASGSEQIIAADILCAGSPRMATSFPLPLSVPVASRIAARVADSDGAQAFQVRVNLIRSGLWATPPAGQILTIGANAADSGGVAVDPGGSINTYGAWSQITGSTSAYIAALSVRIGGANNAAPADSALGFYLDIGVGGSGSEVAIYEGLPFGSQSAGWYGPNPGMWLPAGIPAGSRLAARARSNVTDATDRLFDVVLYGLSI